MYLAALILLVFAYVVGSLIVWNVKGFRGGSPGVTELPTAGSDFEKAANRGFKGFQSKYLLVYSLVMFSDWLKGAYVYALYDSYGFNRKDIADLFVAGFVSSLFCGTYCGAVADKVGRRKMCLFFCITYGLSAITKLSPDFKVLLLGRVLAGIATSLLTTCFEAWMVSEHKSRGYSAKLLDETFAYGTQLNGAAAVMAGIMSSFVATRWGYVAPFLLALLPLVIVFAIVSTTWNENYGERGAAFSFQTALSTLKNDPKLMWLGMAQSCFEAGMFIWVFLWTPALTTAETKADTPYGLIFACFMICIMIGSLVFDVVTYTGGRLGYALHAIAVLTAVVPVATYDTKALVFTSFLVFEMACGVFFPLYGSLRATHLPEESRAALSNFFRFPMNLLVVIVLLTGAQKQDSLGMEF